MTNHDLNYWRQLATRYFEAETTEEEETALRRFAASESADKGFDDLRAVMGLSAIGRQRYKKKRLLKRLTATGVAAMVAVAVTVGWRMMSPASGADDVCVAYIGGKKITNEKVVLAQMQTSMSDFASAIEGQTPEDQLSDFFQGVEDF